MGHIILTLIQRHGVESMSIQFCFKVEWLLDLLLDSMEQFYAPNNVAQSKHNATEVIGAQFILLHQLTFKLLKRWSAQTRLYGNWKPLCLPCAPAIWTDARRPVPRLWIRSAEVQVGAPLGEWENNNNKVLLQVVCCWTTLTVYQKHWCYKLPSGHMVPKWRRIVKCPLG